MVLRLPALAAAAAVLTACAPPEDPTAHPDVTREGSPVRLVQEADADLVLWISNQAFDDPEAAITVTLDGVTVVSGDFHVEDQHTWVRFPLRLTPGAHRIEADTDSGATLRRTFRVPVRGSRYAVLDYWAEDDPTLTWEIHREPVQFG